VVELDEWYTFLSITEERMGKLTSRSAIITGATSYDERAMTLMFSKECSDLIITVRNQTVERQEVGEIMLAGGHCTIFQPNHILMVDDSKMSV
jgi:NAD(P)-dependent dehydrogenase (short-subunit alcohol dehydrogenase family)